MYCRKLPFWTDWPCIAIIYPVLSDPTDSAPRASILTAAAPIASSRSIQQRLHHSGCCAWFVILEDRRLGSHNVSQRTGPDSPVAMIFWSTYYYLLIVATIVPTRESRGGSRRLFGRLVWQSNRRAGTLIHFFGSFTACGWIEVRFFFFF